MALYRFVLTFVLLIFQVFAFSSLQEAKEYFTTLPLKKQLETRLLNAIASNEEDDAKLLLDILNNTPKYKEEFLENILSLPPHTTAIVVDKEKQKLLLINNDRNFTIQTFPCITGKKPGDKLQKGDQRTPNGVYFTKYFIDPKDLSSIYGKGAFPLNYPNIIDKQFFKKSGNGIWLHATDNDERPPFSSNGCVVVTNDIFDQLKPYIQFLQTPIVIVEHFSFTDKKSFENERLSLANFIYNWKKAWEASVNGKTKPYLDYYSDNFVSRYGSKEAFSRYKKAVAQNKRWIKIKLKNLVLAKDGRVLDFGHIYVAAFDMEYDSNNFKWSGKKVLYIIKENGQWKILAEENL